MMPDWEKVKRALRACYSADIEWCQAREKGLCDYNVSYCRMALFKDAAELLEAQKPRLMTLEEVLNAENEAEPLWCEFIDCALGSWRMGWKLKTEGKREVQHILENPIERAIVWESEYEKGWRCWTSRPTDAQREATPWE